MQSLLHLGIACSGQEHTSGSQSTEGMRGSHGARNPGTTPRFRAATRSQAPPGCGHVALVQSLSCGRLSATPWTAAHQAPLSLTISRNLLKLTFIESVMPSSRLILCHPFSLLPSIFPSIRVFSNKSTLHIRGPKCWSFSFSVSPSNECSVLISFRMDWLDLLAAQGTLRSFLQHLTALGMAILVEGPPQVP